MNISKLQETLQAIEDNPAAWNQAHYRWQGTMCFAGLTARLAGYQWKRPGDYSDPFMVDDDGREIHCRTIAIRVLEITNPLDAVMLFRSTNTLEDLREHVQRWVDLGELVSYGAR